MRIAIIFLLLMAHSFSLPACDFCNCYLGLNPGYNKNTIGLRGNLRFASLDIPSQNSRVTHLGHDSPVPALGGTLNETIRSIDLFARIYPVSKLQLLFNLPYSINTIEYHDTVETRSALSDMTLIAMYQIANTMAHDSNAVRHRIFAGGGIKLPTGKYKTPEDVTLPMADDLYSGTGSTDFIFVVSYIGKLHKFGWNADINYKINTENSLNYQYGNSSNINVRAFYEINSKDLIFYPHIGMALESGKADVSEGVTQNNTGGEILYGSAGVDVYYKSISIASDVRLPLYHDLGEGMAVDKSWFITSINIHF